MEQVYPDLDVILITYNHDSFVEQAVESILYQEYPGHIRVIVSDDASEDRTVALIKAAEKKQTRVEFVFLPKTSNLGITKNYQRAFAATSADYVAVLEGDDYWASTKKLLKQVDFLEEHKECAACGCNYYVKTASKNSIRLRLDSTHGYLIATPQILIGDNLIGNFSTCVYRKAALQSLPKKLFGATSYDWITNICIAMFGPIGILCEPLSVYRIHDEGTWNALDASKKLGRQLELLPTYNEITGGVFHEEFEGLRQRLLVELASVENSEPRLLFLKLTVAGLMPPVFLRPLQLLYRKAFKRGQLIQSAPVESC